MAGEVAKLSKEHKQWILNLYQNNIDNTATLNGFIKFYVLNDYNMNDVEDDIIFRTRASEEQSTQALAHLKKVLEEQANSVMQEIPFVPGERPEKEVKTDDSRVDLLSEIRNLQSEIYSIDDSNAYFDVKEVFKLITEAKEAVDKSLRYRRPKNLPSNMIWSEKPYDPYEEFDPYVYDNSMSVEDHDKLHKKGR